MSDEEFDGGSPYLSPSLNNDVRNAMAKGMAENGVDEKPDALTNLPTPNIENLLEKNRSLFSETTIKALENKFSSMVHQNEDGSISQVRFLAKRAEVARLDDLVAEIVKILEMLSGSGYVQGSLLPLARLQLFDDQVAVLSYVMLTPDGVQFFDKNCGDVKLQEGGMPNKLQ
jgi:hypothetical protein